MIARRLGACAAIYVACADPALAHSAVIGVGGFFGGFLHPVLVPAHALSLLALGLFIAQRRAKISSFAFFTAALLAGLTAIALAVGETPAGDILLVTAASTGLLVALASPAPGFVGWMLAATTGAALALDSPPDEITTAAATRALMGTGLGACLALAVVALGASNLRRDWQRVAIRILGSWVAASAILGLALRFAPA